MNEYQLENKTVYHSLIAGFKPAPRKASNSVNIEANLDIRDTIIGVRIRPILPHEAAEGHVSGVCSRTNGSTVVDIHEFRPHVRSKPRLDVILYSEFLEN
jgi:kinesin family protein 2/24